MGIAKIENDRQLDEYFELYKTSKNPEYIDRMIEYMDDENHKYFSVDFNDIEELSSSISSTGENLLDVLIRNYKKVSFINQFQLIKYPEV